MWMRCIFALALGAASSQVAAQISAAGTVCENIADQPSAYYQCVAKQLKAIGEIDAWLQRFGLDLTAQGIARVQEALNQKKVYAIVAARCIFVRQNEGPTVLIDAVSWLNCLKRQEEIERALGNDLTSAAR
jgi:hypothetical protein